MMLLFDIDSIYNFRKSLIVLAQQAQNSWLREAGSEDMELSLLAQLADLEVERCFYEKAKGMISTICNFQNA